MLASHEQGNEHPGYLRVVELTLVIHFLVLGMEKRVQQVIMITTSFSTPLRHVHECVRMQMCQ